MRIVKQSLGRLASLSHNISELSEALLQLPDLGSSSTQTSVHQMHLNRSLVTGDDTNMSKIEGNCHCGSYQFELSGADLSLVRACTCKHCRKAGCLWLPLSTALVYRVIRDDGNLVRYQSKEVEAEASQS